MISKEVFHKVQLYSITLSFIGAAIIVGHGNIFDNLLLFENVGDFIALCASLCWAAYVIAVKYKPSDLSFLSFNYATMLIGTAMIVPLYAIDIFHLNHTFSFTIQNISVILCLSIGVSIIGLMTLNISIIKIGTNTSSLLDYCAPIFTSIMARIFLEEKLKWYHFVEMITIICGVNLERTLNLLHRLRSKTISHL